MIGEWLKQLESSLQGSGSGTDSSGVDSQEIERVAALLLIEVARSDQSIEASELDAIATAIESISSLSRDDIDTLIEASISDADAVVSLHAHVRLVNDRFDKAGRIALVENMWRVAFADGDLDRYEEQRIRTLSDLLYLKHRDFMQAKHRAEHAHQSTG